MNRFFQALLSRFLHENLPDYTIRDEFRLKGMIQFVPGYNPRSRRPPTPRPDFVVLGGTPAGGDPRRQVPGPLGDATASGDAVPTSDLCGRPRTSGGDYPLPDDRRVAKEARIGVREPVYGRQMAQVGLRPVQLGVLEDLVLSGALSPGPEGETTGLRRVAIVGGEDGLEVSGRAGFFFDQESDSCRCLQE